MKQNNIKIHPISESTAPISKEVGQLALDIFHFDKKIIILAPIAGIKKDDIHISVTDDVLVIKGERKPRYLAKDDDYYTKECFWGNFSRSIVLPLEADSSKIKAGFEDNILEINIPKKEIHSTKVIKIAA